MPLEEEEDEAEEKEEHCPSDLLVGLSHECELQCRGHPFEGRVTVCIYQPQARALSSNRLPRRRNL